MKNYLLVNKVLGRFVDKLFETPAEMLAESKATFDAGQSFLRRREFNGRSAVFAAWELKTQGVADWWIRSRIDEEEGTPIAGNTDVGDSNMLILKLAYDAGEPTVVRMVDHPILKEPILAYAMERIDLKKQDPDILAIATEAAEKLVKHGWKTFQGVSWSSWKPRILNS